MSQEEVAEMLALEEERGQSQKPSTSSKKTEAEKKAAVVAAQQEAEEQNQLNVDWMEYQSGSGKRRAKISYVTTLSNGDRFSKTGSHLIFNQKWEDVKPGYRKIRLTKVRAIAHINQANQMLDPGMKL